MLPRFLGKISRLVMIGNSYLRPFHSAVLHALIASTQPPESPIARHQGIEESAQLRMCL